MKQSVIALFFLLNELTNICSWITIE